MRLNCLLIRAIVVEYDSGYSGPIVRVRAHGVLLIRTPASHALCGDVHDRLDLDGHTVWKRRYPDCRASMATCVT